MSNNSETFSWSDEKSIVVAQVDAIAVYTNPVGDVVIRQQDTAHVQEDDSFVVIPRSRVPDVIEALKREIAG